MKFYRVTYSKEGGTNGGYSWHASRAEAEKAARKAFDDDPAEYAQYGLDNGMPKIEMLECETNRTPLLNFLNRYASEPQNG
jgi:hypothetical protein